MRIRPSDLRTLALALAIPAAALLALPGTAAADNCIQGIYYNGDAPSRYVFPNWQRVYGGSYTIWLFDTGLSPSSLDSLTLINFGTATGGPGQDITGVYFVASCTTGGSCGAPNTGTLTMTYAGTYQMGDLALAPYPAWTWNGPNAQDFSCCGDLCGTPACGGFYTLQVYYDIGPCAVESNDVNIGFGNNTVAAVATSGLADTEGCMGPWGETHRGGDVDTIIWAYKLGPDAKAPGDIVSYTIYYGKPGTAIGPGGMVVFDTLPSYVHYVASSAVPAPDPLYDPNPGPPMQMKWTFPGPITTTGGATGIITFNVTVDWGNGDAFEPGSGDIAAPEASRLDNRAQVAWDTTCTPKGTVTGPVQTFVRRLLFWKVGDNDILFANALGQPPDEMIYSIFAKNLSLLKTWWNVSVWDTVPAEIDPWCFSCGFEDPCMGWTMTPSGCAAASPGRVVVAGKTILTWALDMPPQYTLTLRWKGQVRSTAPNGSTAVNIASIRAKGRTGIAGGTGDSGVPRQFTHVAPILLRVTYVSYVGYDTASNGKACPGFFIAFFPLNKMSQFELRGIQYLGGLGISSVGGLSESIGCIIGDCITGFPGNASCILGSGAIPGGGTAGCKVERSPARYDPPIYDQDTGGGCPADPFTFIYKVTSNSPVAWQLLTHMNNCNQDSHTWAPSTELTYRGFMHYAWVSDTGAGLSTYAGYDGAVMVNTGINYQDVFDANRQTTVHAFKWNAGSLDWDYQTTYEIAGDSVAMHMFTMAAGDSKPWRFMSSDSRLVIDMGFSIFSTQCCCGSGGDNHGTFAPARETGFSVRGAPGNFYAVVEPNSGIAREGILIVGSNNTAATYNIWTYTPDSTVGNPLIPSLLRGVSGSWLVKATDSIGPGCPTVAPWTQAQNMWVYPGTPLKRGGSNIAKIEVTSGGPIQVMHGAGMYSVWAGGAVMHAFAGPKGVYASGTEFWLHQTNSAGQPTVMFFMPKQASAMQAYDCGMAGGYTAAYTTTGPDQAIVFRRLTGPPANLDRTGTRFLLTAGAATMGCYNQDHNTEKGFTAPFLASGVHYTIIAPSVVYVGQNFWITVLVEQELGGTETDYCGTTSFSSTDPAAKIEGTAMDSYNYTWKSDVAAATCDCGSACGDNGIRIFFNLTMNKIGTQTIVATDTLDGSITGLGVVTVVGADVKLEKQPRLSVQASGDTVTFKVCWSNYSSASAFTFVITDAVPMGTVFLPETGTWTFACGSTDNVPVVTAYSTATTVTVPLPASWVTANPVAATRWLRWTVPMAGVQTTGCACYRVTVN